MCRALLEVTASIAYDALVALVPLEPVVPFDAMVACAEVLELSSEFLRQPTPQIWTRPKLELIATPPEKPVPVEEPKEEAADLDPSRCRALLLEIVRRAVHDWVLYRQHTEMKKKQRALAAHTWLFEECPGHQDWEERKTAKFDTEDGTIVGARAITSFLAICEAVDIDPEAVRSRARTMTVRDIIHAGRPAERRRSAREDNVSIEEHGVWVDVDWSTFGEPGEGEETEYVGYTDGLREYM